MPSRIFVTDSNKPNFEKYLIKYLKKTKPKAFGIAVAYVSIYGINRIKKILSNCEIDDVKLIADIRDAVTHPEALRIALNCGWDIKTVNDENSTFHSKLYIAGEKFDDLDEIINPKIAIVGSHNLSKNGLEANVECSSIYVDMSSNRPFSQSWKDLWSKGSSTSKEEIDVYEINYANRNKNRSVKDLQAFGVKEIKNGTNNPNTYFKNNSAPPDKERLINLHAATLVWVGLQSFTGLYNLQIEFPRKVGLILRKMFDFNNNTIDIFCKDGVERGFTYKYYDRNGMFRLNVPNDTPLKDWVLENRNGIAVIEIIDGSLNFRIIKPSKELEEIQIKSIINETWGKTSTRYYGWL